MDGRTDADPRTDERAEMMGTGEGWTDRREGGTKAGRTTPRKHSRNG